MTRAALGRSFIALCWMAAITGLAWLGTWQVHRLAWKRDLIAMVDARIDAAPVAAPPMARASDAYLRVMVTGAYLQGRESFVQAVTARGPGWWVMTPLRTATGATILVNRGYISRRTAASPPGGPVRVVGLLRTSEPGGGFLRRNDPASDRWYSRDVAAIATRHGIGSVANYFIDADGARNAPGQPVGGLTVIAFANNHLAYAITWYVLAAMAAAGFAYWLAAPRRGTSEPVSPRR